MKKLTVIYLVLFVLFLALPAITMPFFQGDGNSEKRELSDFPQLKTEEGTWNTEYTDELDTWISEHIGFRSLLVEANSAWQAALFHQSSEDSVVVGQDGWLFYAETEKDYLNVATLSNRNIHNIVHTMEMVQDYVEEQGASFVLTVIPNKNTVYPQWMPYNYVPLDEKGNFELLEEALASSSVNYADVKSALMAEDEVLYQRLDSHWDYRGALIGYRTILNKSGYPHKSFDNLTFESRSDWDGDLAGMLYAAAAEKDVQYYPLYDFNYEVTSHMANVDAITLQMVNASGQGNLVMFRDSFGNALQSYLAESFAETLLSREYPFRIEYVEQYNADVCGLEIVERNIENLAKRAPIMPAQETVLPENMVEVPEEALRIETEEKNSYVHVYGIIDEAYLDTSYQVYILTEEGTAYEAFPIFEQELLKGDVLSDNGFSAYFPEEAWENMIIKGILVTDN